MKSTVLSADTLRPTNGLLESQSLDDQSTKVRNTSIWDVTQDAQQQESPRLVIGNGLPNVIPSDLSLLDTSLILPHSSDHDQLLLVAESSESHGRIR